MECLPWIAGQYPQSESAGFVFCLKPEWQFISRVTQDSANYFPPLEDATRKKFLPALFDVSTDFIGGEFHELLGHSIRTGRIGIHNPVTMAGAAFQSLCEASPMLVHSLLGKCKFRCYRHAA
ncbi:hypothetical protein ACHAWF_001721 [Thalassiosira exigua]